MPATARGKGPEVWSWRPLRFNEILLAFDRPVGAGALRSRAGALDPELGSLVPIFREHLEPVRKTREPLTDDRAPVEWLTDQMITSYIARGGELDEDHLPTAP